MQKTLIHRFNINDNVEVKLTDYGKQVWKNKYNEVFVGKSPFMLDDAGIAAKQTPQGYWVFQLWDLMYLFGHVLHNGGMLVFENNEISISLFNLQDDEMITSLFNPKTDG